MGKKKMAKNVLYSKSKFFALNVIIFGAKNSAFLSFRFEPLYGIRWADIRSLLASNYLDTGYVNLNLFFPRFKKLLCGNHSLIFIAALTLDFFNANMFSLRNYFIIWLKLTQSQRRGETGTDLLLNRYTVLAICNWFICQFKMTFKNNV